MPISYQRPLSNDFDQRGEQAVAEMLSAHQPMLAVSTLGLPGLAVPTGLIDGVPIGVQLVAGRFQEELCLAAGVVIESDPAALTPIDPVLSCIFRPRTIPGHLHPVARSGSIPARTGRM